VSPGVNYAAVMDVGGTSLTSAIVDSTGSVLSESLNHCEINSTGPAETILKTFAAILKSALLFAQLNDLDVLGIGISICGPFNYNEGISQIRGLNKYEAIYGFNVQEELRARLNIHEDVSMIFDHDASSFARGEAWSGAASDYRRTIVLTLGTGLGSAFVVDGVVVEEGRGIPRLGWIAGQPYREGLVDHYTSNAHIMKLYRERTGKDLDVIDIAGQAFAGDNIARDVFREVATTIGSVLLERHIIPFGAESIILGGQIAKSYELYLSGLSDQLIGVPSLKAIKQAADIDHSALKGVAKILFNSCC
jgi:glucokinase